MKVKYINLNIWSGRLLDQAVDFLKKENADILSLQEVYNGKDPSLPKHYRTLEILVSELGLPYHIYHSNFLDARDIPIEMGNAILSRFSIVSNDTAFLTGKFGRISQDGIIEELPRNILQAEIDARGLKINVFNMHGIWGQHGDDTKERLLMVEKIVKIISGKPKTILSGDFNFNERIFGTKMSHEIDLSHWYNTESVKKLEAVLQNVFKNERITSFNMKRKEHDIGYAKAVVDMVFVSSDIQVLKHEQPNIDISDHLPQVCVFEV
jgi:endonuclease/exonuclease/phosphatase family metal-dependent hydrolase